MAGDRRLMMIVGGIGVLFLAVVIAVAILSKPYGEELDGSAPQPQPEHSQPPPAAKKPPLN